MRTLARCLLLIIVSFPSLVFAAASYDSLNFKPATDSGYYLATEGSQTLGRNKWTVGLTTDYAHIPVIQVNAANVKLQDVISREIAAHLTAAYGITPWMNVGLLVSGVPYMVFHPVNSALTQTTATMGDIKLNFKFCILDPEKFPVGLAAVPFVTFPTGSDSHFTGNGVFTGGGSLVLETKRIAERFSMNLNAGYTAREGVALLAGTRADDTFTFGAGANFSVHPIVDTILEIRTATLKDDFFGSQYRPIEVDGGVRVFPTEHIAVTVGGGAGVLKSIGSPTFRALASVTWIPEHKGYSSAYWEERRKDTDGDGVRDYKDRCPSEPGPKSNKGCPKEMKVALSPDEYRILTQMIHFNFAKATLRPSDIPILETLASTLNAKPTIRKISIEGHTDFIGSDAYNQRLSEARAETVRKFLVRRGVDDERLTAVGYGKTRPINPARTGAARATNRRVEFVLKDVEGMKIPADVPPSTQPTLPESKPASPESHKSKKN